MSCVHSKDCLPLVVGVLFCVTVSAFSETKSSTQDSSLITQYKHRLKLIESSLSELASFSIRGGFGPIGVSSRQYANPEQSIWIEIDLGKETPIDQIVLVPTISQNTRGEVQADGFPVEFTVLGGCEKDRKAPLVIDCSLQVSWVRIEISKLSHHALNKRYIFKLAEVLVFNGPENVALRRPVTTSSEFIFGRYAQHPQFVTDGFLPYIMNSAKGSGSDPVLSKGGTNKPYTLTVDLGEAHSLSYIHLHALYSNYFVPLYTTSDTGIPHHWILEGALTEDFSNPRVLAEVQYASLLEVGPILQHRVESLPSRYLRFRESEPSFESNSSPGQRTRRVMGFAEIELIANGQNVVLGRPFTANFKTSRNKNVEKLTDGKSFYGEILPIRRWLNELAERRDLEIERKEISLELDLLYSQQQTRLMWMQRVALWLAGGVLVVIFIGRMMSLRKIIRIRERMAANLHDELSADLHAVALLGELAHKNIDHKAKLSDILVKMRDLSRHSRHSVRDCMNMLQAETACDDLVEELKRTSQRLLTEVEHQLHINGVEWVEKLSRRKHLDISLYYKECLINVLRHSDASSCQTHLSGTADHVLLEFSDNGQLIKDVPPSLQRRADLLRATLYNQATQGGGNHLVLVLNTRSFFSRLLRPDKGYRESMTPPN